MKKFLIEWTEEVTNNCCVEIEAKSEKQAIDMWNNGEFEDYERDEANNSFSKLESIKEVKNE